MKTAIKLLVMTAISALLMHCSDSIERDLINYEAIETSLNGQILVDQIENSLAFNSECVDINNCLNGIGKSTAPYLNKFNLSSQFDLTVNDQVHFKNGRFTFLVDNNSVIFGEYQGCGTQCENTVEAEITLTVLGGTGYYTNASGMLTGKVSTFSQSPCVLMIEFQGNVISQIVQ